MPRRRPSAPSDSATEMTQDDVVEILGLLVPQVIDVWVDGGWGVDALLGYQSRTHNDIDLVVSHSDVERLSEARLAQPVFGVWKIHTITAAFSLALPNSELQRTTPPSF
jgi:hypothetical protein